MTRRPTNPVWLVFVIATLAAMMLATVLLAQPATPSEPVPVKVVQPVPASDTTLAAVWMAGVSGVLALGSAALQMYSARKAAADKMQYDAEMIRLRTDCDHWKAEVEQCERRSRMLEAQIEDFRNRLAAAEAGLRQLTKG